MFPKEVCGTHAEFLRYHDTLPNEHNHHGECTACSILHWDLLGREITYWHACMRKAYQEARLCHSL